VCGEGGGRPAIFDGVYFLPPHSHLGCLESPQVDALDYFHTLPRQFLKQELTIVH